MVLEVYCRKQRGSREVEAGHGHVEGGEKKEARGERERGKRSKRGRRGQTAPFCGGLDYLAVSR